MTQNLNSGRNSSVTKHNALIEASYRLTLNEMRLLLYGISLINPLKTDFPTEFKIDIARFASIFKTDKDGLYDDLKKSIIKKFWQREFSYRLISNEVRLSRWLDQVDYYDKEGYLKIYFSERIKPLLNDISKNFTTFLIEEIASFKSIYAVRIYELAVMNLNRSNEHKCRFNISISVLRDKLDLNNEYKRFCDFKVRVLEKSRFEINKYSKLSMSYNVEKLGRTPNSITFNVKLKKTEEDFKKAEIVLQNKDIKEKKRRSNHYPVNATNNNFTNLSAAFSSLLKKMGPHE